MTMDLDEVIKSALDTQTLSPLGVSGAGCISKGAGYLTDQGRVFIKENSGSTARLMFDGELESLRVLQQANIVKVPKPIKVIDRPGGGALLVTEFLEIGHGLSNFSAQLGELLARLHLQNELIGRQKEKSKSSVHHKSDVEYVGRFGFHVPTCCGYLPQENTWDDDWLAFYAKKIDFQIRKLETEQGDRELRELWSRALVKLPSLFTGLEIRPALLHGDLWAGNADQTWTQPVVFDPASFYGHSEYDLAIARMFGGFNAKFFSSYFSVIPQAPGYEKRLKLYQFFHYVNHWNLFGAGYKSSAVQTLKSVLT